MNTPDINWRDLGWTGLYLDAVVETAQALKDQTKAIESCTNLLFDAWRQKRWVFIIGNGGSASTATHLAADLAKTVISNPDQFGLKVLSLADNIPLASAIVNDWGKEYLFDPTLGSCWEPDSVLVAFSVHGGSGSDKAGLWSQNLVRAIRFAKDHGGKTIGFAGFDGGAMKELCDICIIVPADSTPVVESFHVVLHHLIAFRLKYLIKTYIHLQDSSQAGLFDDAGVTTA